MIGNDDTRFCQRRTLVDKAYQPERFHAAEKPLDMVVDLLQHARAGRLVAACGNCTLPSHSTCSANCRKQKAVNNNFTGVISRLLKDISTWQPA